ncbi:hypothetical protein JX265_008728 [Neoarthrinium moseri]|uniref:NADP-dependent oxidoreductase domain-containing protein n=1 Tax=Neoarthrinium moseri TaxID=1658444 RepID=A0A9Q0AN61_9PEZI|nr:uncharacterized protein JN550_008795 [Neoarthrinium moseri]KAI1863511.1 hypothetical protein JX265_008728 [Neoarthrinium moseri]KAI1864508.1 hypothetical protein JN550_008795 [Neoarthrinium moseri]
MDYKTHALGFGKAANDTGNHRRSLYMTVRDSLGKLQMDYIDILHVHVWDYTTSNKELMVPLQYLDVELRMSEARAKVAAEHGIESVTAIALVCVMKKALNVFPVVGGRKLEHIHDNIQAFSIRLIDGQIQYLESVQAFDMGFPTMFTGPDPNVMASHGSHGIPER